MSAKNIALEGSKRESTGKGAARALRREGKVPAVIYGDQKDPVTIILDGNEVKKEYFKGGFFTTLCDVKIEGDKHLVLARDVQTHPVSDAIEHIDFLRVTKKTRIPVDIPVNFINEEESPGLRDIGVLSVVRYTVEILCSALEIPENVEADLAGLEIGDSVKSTDIKLPSGAEFVISDRDFAIASIIEPKAPPVEEEETAEGAEGAEGEEGAAEEGAEASEGGDDAGAEEEKSE